MRHFKLLFGHLMPEAESEIPGRGRRRKRSKKRSKVVVNEDLDKQKTQQTMVELSHELSDENERIHNEIRGLREHEMCMAMGVVIPVYCDPPVLADIRALNNGLGFNGLKARRFERAAKEIALQIYLQIYSGELVGQEVKKVAKMVPDALKKRYWSDAISVTCEYSEDSFVGFPHREDGDALSGDNGRWLRIGCSISNWPELPELRNLDENSKFPTFFITRKSIIPSIF